MENTMQERFKGFSKYSDKEYNEIWENATIVVDTNVLLNFYRFSDETRDSLYEILKSLKKRLWIPYQVALEYFKNKENTIITVNNDFDKLLNDSNKCFLEITKCVEQKSSKKLKCKEKLLEELEKNRENIKKIIIESKAESNKEASEENVEKMIFELFDNKLGEKIDGDEYEKMKEEGLKRFEEQIPPGYKDSNKDENGDYYIFYSMIKYATEQDKNIIFVTDDVKEDWFIKRFGEIKSGNYKLLNEFFCKTGKLLLVYTLDGFIHAYQKNVKNPKKVDTEVINELIDNRQQTKENLSFREYRLLRYRIKNSIRRLYGYKLNSMHYNLNEIENIKKSLIKLNISDEYLESLVRILQTAIMKDREEDVEVILKSFSDLIFRNYESNDDILIKNDELIKNKMLELEMYNEERENLLNSLYSIMSKIRRSNKINTEKKVILKNKISTVIEGITNIRNLKEHDIEMFKKEIDKIMDELNDTENAML